MFVFTVFGAFLLAAVIFVVMMLVFIPFRRLLGAGMMMLGIMLFMGMLAATWYFSARTVHRARTMRRMEVEMVRTQTEAAALRAAAEMKRMDGRHTRPWPDPSAPHDVVTDSLPPSPDLPVSPEAPDAPAAVSEIADSDEINILPADHESDEPEPTADAVASAESTEPAASTTETPVPAAAADSAPSDERPAESATANDVAQPSAPLEAAPAAPVDAAPAETPPAQAATPPAWVQQPPDQIDGHMALVLVSDPFEDRFACNADLERRTQRAIVQLAHERCRQQGLPSELPIKVTYDEIGMVSRERFYQLRPSSVGDMLQGYQLTVLDDAFQRKLDLRIKDAVVDRRLTTTGIVSGGTLVVVSMLFGAFRFVARKAPDPLSA
jgi:hypothetical protein